MVFLVHFVIAGIYVALAVAAAWYLPGTLERVLPVEVLPSALAWGAATLGLLATLHAAFTSAMGRSASQRQMAELRATYGEVNRELGQTRGEVRRLETALEAANDPEARRQAVKDVVAEVKVLQNLIEDLYKNRNAAPAAATRREADAQVPAEQPPVVVGLDDSDVLEIVREALQVNRVDLFLQPIVSLPQRKHRFYECFSRLRDGGGAMILPEQYIPIAAREGLVGTIDNMLLFRCVQLLRKTQRRQPNVGFFCNISAHTLSDSHFFGEFIAFMAENRELAPNLVFEFVQDDIAEMTDEAARHLEQLGALGFRFSLDRVKRLDLDYRALSRRFFRFVKVDAETLIRHLRSVEDRNLLTTYREMLDESAIDLIAEKVEDEATLVEVLEYKLDYGQGFLFGEPRRAKDV